MENPYLSFCVHSRNDNHGGDMYRRMKTCLMGFFEQAERHRLRSEIVLVDWNPPINKPLLKDIYQWPKHSEFCSIRLIVVPLAIHQRYIGWEKIPVNNCAAQNVAIKRANGNFILSTCVDNLLSDELVRFLASEKLEENKIYRMDRSNVHRAVTRLKSLNEQLSYCSQNVVSSDPFLPDQSLPGFDGAPGLYTGAPGDFTLMARKYWHEVHGYPEIDLVGRTSDSVLCYMAYLAGTKIEALCEPMRLYHIDHDVRTNSPESNWWARMELENALPEWLVQILKTGVRKVWPAKNEFVRRGISIPLNSELAALIVDMLKGNRSYVYNGDAWGLGDEHLEEFVIVQSEASLAQPEPFLAR